MADVNGASEESVKVEPTVVKVEVNGGEADSKKDVIKEDSVNKEVIKEDSKNKEVIKEENVKEEKKPIEVKTELDPETLKKKIKRQLEYYFGDYNLPSDKFLKEQVKNNDGWVPLETMLKFRRLAALTNDAAVIVAALANSDLVQINEEKTEVRRNPDKPLPVESEARRKEVLTRSVYVKGFPIENFTVDNALDFFEDYGQTEDIVMRHWHDKAEKVWKYKGSCFVVFPTKEAAAAFLAIEDVKFGETPLIRMWQEEYIEQKRKERLDQKLQKRKAPVEDDKKPEEEKSLPKNATLHMTKCPEGLTREVVRDKVEEFGLTVAFVDFNKGDEEGWIRLHEVDGAPKVMEKCEGGVLKVEGDLQVELRALEGDEEEKFLVTAQQSINARRAKGGNRGRGRRGGGRGGGRGHRGGGHWRSRRHDSGEPASKRVKTESGDGD